MTRRELVRIRESLGMTPAAFARWLNTSQQNVSRWERGERKIRSPWPDYIRLRARQVQAPAA